jgi:hypothetical protein
LSFILDLKVGTIKTVHLPAPIRTLHSVDQHKWLVLFAPNDPEERLSRTAVLTSESDRGVTLKAIHRKVMDDRSGDPTDIDSSWSVEYVSGPLKDAIPGVLTDDSVRFLRQTRNDDERMCMAMGLVESLERGNKTRVFELSGATDDDVKLLGGDAEEVPAGVETSPRVSTVMLGQSQLAIELREKSVKEPFALMTVFDIVRHTRRSIKIGLEDDLDGSGSAASMHANKAKEEALKKQKVRGNKFYNSCLKWPRGIHDVYLCMSGLSHIFDVYAGSCSNPSLHYIDDGLVVQKLPRIKLH